MTTTIIDGLAGDKAHYARETDLSYGTWAVRLIAATMQVPSGSDYGRGLFVDLDDEKEYTIYEQQGASPAATDFPVKNVPLAVLSDDLLAKIGLIDAIQAEVAKIPRASTAVAAGAAVRRTAVAESATTLDESLRAVP